MKKERGTFREGACLEEALAEAVREERPLRDLIFRGEQLSELFCERTDFIHVRFENCRLLECNFSKAGFEDAEFVGCDLSNCDFSQAYWKNSSVREGKAQGAVFYDGVLKGCRLEGCKLDYAGFHNVLLEETAVVNCSFKSAALTGMKLKKTVFREDRFDSADFFKTSFRGIDLSDCVLERPILSEDFRELRGAVLNSLQAVALALMMGIEVK